MNKKIIQIDQSKCVGCGLCAKACHQGAIEMIDGKATVVRDDYCDGLGRCLPVCPVDAISFSDKDIINTTPNTSKKQPSCPSSNVKTFSNTAAVSQSTPLSSELKQWPVQIKLAPANAAFFDNANLLVAADCAAYAYANFHQDFMRNKVTLIGCPKLDMVDYTQKLTEIISHNNIKSLSIVRMQVPCCSGIENACVTALKNSGKFIPWSVTTLSTSGQIIDN